MTEGDRVRFREPAGTDNGDTVPVGGRGMVVGFEGERIVVSLDEGDVAVVEPRVLEVVNRGKP